MSASSLPTLVNPLLETVLAHLRHLSLSPPQVMLLEGGTEEERRDLARYWACCNMCQKEGGNGPCFECTDCQRIVHDEHFDIMAYDGGIARKDEDENAFFQSFNAENARNIRIRLRDAPRGRYRIVFFTGIAKSRPEAPNALLKLLEEPSSTSLFVLLVSQRNQILPTLVSRSFCLTLPWPEDTGKEPERVLALTSKLAAFFVDRDDFLSTVSDKSHCNETLASYFISALQKSLVRVLAGEPKTDLDSCLIRLAPQQLQQAIFWTNEAGSMLRLSVPPSRVLTALAMRLHVLFRF